MSVIIRKAKGEDAERILEYCKAIGAETENLTFGAEGIYNMTAEQEQKYLESIYHSDKQLYLVAENDGQIVGSCCFSVFPKARLSHRGEVSISVRKAAWGQHIGTQLMEAMLDFARNVSHTEIISLEVRSDNARAIALYRKFGFQKIGTFKGFMKINGEYIDSDIMCLHL